MSGSGIMYPAEAWTPTAGAEPPAALKAAFDWQSTPFSHIFIDKLVRGGTRISWALTPGFNKPAPLQFTVSWARAGSQDWETVGSIDDAYYLVDSSRRDYSDLLEGVYRVVLSTADGSTYTSRAANFPATWAVKDLVLYNELRRQQLLLMQERGLTVWILFRRNWGTACTASDCADPVTGEARNPKCSTCYGTGFVGGYWAPYRTQGLLRGSIEDTQVQHGTRHVKKALLRVIPLPVISERDVIIMDGTDERFAIEQVKTVAEFKGRPIAQELQLRALPPSDAVYDLTWSGSKDPADGEQSW